MTFYLGLIFGLILGAISATAYLSYAQLAPVESTLGESLQWSRTEQALSLQRELERREHHNASPRNPCPY